MSGKVLPVLVMGRPLTGAGIEIKVVISLTTKAHSGRPLTGAGIEIKQFPRPLQGDGRRPPTGGNELKYPLTQIYGVHGLRRPSRGA